MSTHAQVLYEVARIMRKKKEMHLHQLRNELQTRIHHRLRVDFLAANLLGQPGYYIDCENYTLIKLQQPR